MTPIAHILRSSQSDQDSYDQIMDELWEKSNDGFHTETLSETEKHFIRAEQMHQSIFSGGINSLFYNHAGKLAAEGLIACRALGDHKIAEIIEEAIACFPVRPVPEDLEACRQLLESWPDDNDTDRTWFRLTDAYYESISHSPSVRLGFIRNNLHLLS